MNQALPQFPIPRKEASLNAIDREDGQLRNGSSSTAFTELAHELRQPLGVIDSLAYYLEITSADAKVCSHVRRIQAMVCQANRILDHSCLLSDTRNNS